MHQLSSDVIVVIDKNNDCLRQIDRDSQNVTTFAGNCTNSGNFQSRKEILATEARYTTPVVGALNNDSSLMYYWLLQEPSTLVQHDLQTGQ